MRTGLTCWKTYCCLCFPTNRYTAMQYQLRVIISKKDVDVDVTHSNTQMSRRKNWFCILTNADMKASTHAKKKKKNWNRNQGIMHTLIHSFITILLVKESTYQNSTVPPFTLMANPFLSPFHATLYWTQAARKSQKRCKMPQQSGWFWSKSDFLEVFLLLRSLTPQLVLLWRR